MAGRLLGVVVAGGGGASLDPLVSPGEAALTPFAGKYRFIDFALATLGNSGIHDTYVVTPETDTTVSAHVAWRGNGARPPHVVRSLSVAASPGQRRIDALRQVFDAVARIVERGQAAGEFRSELDPRLASFVFYGALEAILTGWVLGQLSDGDDDVWRAEQALVEIVCSGLAVVGEPAPA